MRYIKAESLLLLLFYFRPQMKEMGAERDPLSTLSLPKLHL